MCGIAGFYNPHDHYLKEKEHCREILTSMAQCQKHRGPDDSGLFLSEHGGLSHARLRSEERRVGKECRSRWSPYH